MPVLSEVLKANETYAASFGAKSQLAMPPARRFAILTCMDARLSPARYAGLAEGDAHVIRNAGGRASDDAIRSLVISYKLLGTREWFVIHHSDCGMALFDDEIMSGLLEQSLETATIDEKGWHDHGPGPGSVHGHYECGGRRQTHPLASIGTGPYSDIRLLLRCEDRPFGRSAGSNGRR
jgi:carbonic anhydrase